jgi:hypothetical protein
MTVLKSDYVARVDGVTYPLDRAPFPKSPSKCFEGFSVGLEVAPGIEAAPDPTPGGATGSAKEHYYTYFLFDGESYSFKRGVDIPRNSVITMVRAAPAKRVAAPKPEKVEAAPVAAPEPETAPEVEPETAKPKRVRKPKAAK